MTDEAAIPNECNCHCGGGCEECLTLVIDDEGNAEYLCDCAGGPVCVCRQAHP